MRTILPFVAVAVVLVGCEHRDRLATPNRGHYAAGTPGTPAAQPMAQPDEALYTVREGDTLTSIAKTSGVTVEHLIRRNKLAGDIKPGMQLVVPAAPKPTKR